MKYTSLTSRRNFVSFVALNDRACCWPKTSETEREEAGQRSEWSRVTQRAALLTTWRSWMVFSEKEPVIWWTDLQMKMLTRNRSQDSHFTSELLPRCDPSSSMSSLRVTYLFVPLLNSVSDAEGRMKVMEVATRPLNQDLLSHDVRWCIIDQIKDGCQCLKLGVVVQLILLLNS